MLGVMDASSLPAFTRMFPSPLSIIHTRLHGSLCVTATWGNMVGKKHRIDMAVLAEVAKARGDPWYATGWNSVQQLNDYFQRNGSPFVCVRTRTTSREKDMVSNPFLQNQPEGLFLLKVKCKSVRSAHQQVDHLIGLDFNRREIIDTFVKGRRPLDQAQWDAIGIVDWQCTWCICEKVRSPA